MSFGKETAPMAGFKKFVTEDEVAEARQKRQEEWEKVRKPEDPTEAPEEVVDNRSLYDKLQAQKQEKDDEYTEKHKLSNQIRGLDDDEAGFLQEVSEKQEGILQAREAEETQLLAEFHSATKAAASGVLSANNTSRPTPRAPVPISGKKSQAALLAGAVKRKISESTNISQAKKAKDGACASVQPDANTAQIIGVLPGLGSYDSSDSDSTSSDSEIELPTNVFETRKIILAHNHNTC